MKNRGNPPSRTCERIEGVKGNFRRKIVLLKSTEDDDFINIASFLSGLSEKLKRYFFASFDQWLSGNDSLENRYRGWDQEPGGKYHGCFVFKYTAKTHALRLYGFLCNSSSGRFQLCVLAHAARRRVTETDIGILIRLLPLMGDSGILKSCKEFVAK